MTVVAVDTIFTHHGVHFLVFFLLHVIIECLHRLKILFQSLEHCTDHLSLASASSTGHQGDGLLQNAPGSRHLGFVTLDPREPFILQVNFVGDGVRGHDFLQTITNALLSFPIPHQVEPLHGVFDLSPHNLMFYEKLDCTSGCGLIRLLIFVIIHPARVELEVGFDIIVFEVRVSLVSARVFEHVVSQQGSLLEV